jgi:Family of unknown function (DUF5670)
VPLHEYVQLCAFNSERSIKAEGPLQFARVAFERVKKMSIWTILFVVPLLAWIGGFTVFHVAGALIHLLLVFAVISLILHFVVGRRAV